MSKTFISVQTKAIIPPNLIQQMEEILKNKNFQLTKEVQIEDKYFCNPLDIDPNLHTYEKTGTTLRHRAEKVKYQVTHKIQKLESLRKTGNKYEHDIYRIETSYEGNKPNTKLLKELCIKENMSEKLLNFKKKRSIYSTDNSSAVIAIDTIHTGVKIMVLLKEKEMLSGEAFRDTGDGWHENPTYDQITQDVYVLNRRIIDVKEELAKLR